MEATAGEGLLKPLCPPVSSPVCLPKAAQASPATGLESQVGPHLTPWGQAGAPLCAGKDSMSPVVKLKKWPRLQPRLPSQQPTVAQLSLSPGTRVALGRALSAFRVDSARL